MEARFIDQDLIQPTSIEHRCEEIFDGDELAQKFSYIIYHFDCDGAYIWARAYLEDIATISLYGPFESRATMRPMKCSFDEAVLAYLGRRFRNIQALRDDGYAPI